MRDEKGRFIKGNQEGNLVLKTYRENGGIVWNKGKKGLQIAWNKGLSIYCGGGFKKGCTPWNKGLKGCMGGEASPHWKGGLTPLSKRLQNSLEYKLWRKSIFERDDYTCQMCGIRGGDLEADHIKPQSLFPKLRFAIDNGRTLCLVCHKATETWGYKLVEWKNRNYSIFAN
jgi:hypothetical protein